MPISWTPRVGLKEIFLAIAGVGGDAAAAAGQGTPLVRVFVECAACDADHLRQELTFVNLVRDRMLANVHALVTSLPTGAGGSAYTLEFAGRIRDRNVADTLTVVVAPDATDLQRREQLARQLKVGLLPFLRDNAVLSHLDVTYRAPARVEGDASRGARDRWNQWVFRIGGSGHVDGDDNYSSHGASMSLTAGRVTEALKVNVAVEAGWDRSRYNLANGDLVTSQRRDWSGRALVVKSLGPRLSAGFAGGASSSLYENMALVVKLMPAVEYDLFPYAEATQRQIVARWAVGGQSVRYVDTTVFGRIRETRPLHELSAAADVRQRWGEVGGSARWSQYLHDPSKQRLTFDGSVSWRILAGLTVHVGANYAYIRDQLNIPGTDLTDPDRLLRLRELQSGFSASGGIGFSYTFGSAFSNVVNPRFRL